MNTASRYYRLQKSGDTFRLAASVRPVLKPGPRQVLLRMGAASLNYRDLLALHDPASREGLVPLSDGAGTIVALGEETSLWAMGEQVSPNFFPLWRRGPFQSGYMAQALGGGQTDGVLNEYMVVDETALVAVAEHLSLVEAATLPCAGLTAWHALFERGQLQPDETVLVQGTGGVAVFGLQLAVAHGARVIVTSSSDAKLERARSMGAWQTVNYREQPEWDRAVLELTDGRGVDHIIELGGPQTYDRSITAIAAGGRIAQIGVLTGFGAKPNLSPLQFKNASINGICVGSVEQFRRMNQFLAAHSIHPVVDQEFHLEEAADAYQKMREASHFGKLVIRFPG